MALLPWVRLMINGAAASKAIPQMSNLPEPGDDDEPLGLLSVVVAARNEAAEIEQALRSLAMQDHPNMEIIVVNDRSTDGTAEIIDKLSAEFQDKIKAVHVTELPEGWLGKCNALQQGGEAATGEYILFADADVKFEKSVLRRSHYYARTEDADQFCVFPDNMADSFFEKAMLNVFALCFFLGFPPHKAMKRNSGKYVGVGAFNMVRTTMYRKIKGHNFLRLQVIDDVGLGKLIKYSGGRVRIAWSGGMVKVRWQENLLGMIRGLEKNFFAATNYSIAVTLLMVIGVIIMFLWPWIGVWFGPTGARVIVGVALLLQILTAAAAATKSRIGAVHGITGQMGAVLLLIAMIGSAWATLKNGGITWRDSFYPLKDLKQFKL